MSVDKVILRAVLSTLAAIVLLFGFMFTVLITVYPSTMMGFTYSLGMETSSIRYAERAYKRSDDVYYIAHATQTAIEIENYKKINSCGMKLIADDEFVAFCAEKNAKNEERAGDYEQYIYGQVCVAKYKLGEKQAAVENAFSFTEENEFPINNAIVAVLITSLRAEDGETVDLIEGKLKERTGTLSESDKAYFDEILRLIAE